MTLHVLYFASLREALGTSGEQIELPADLTSVGDLRAHIASRGEPWVALATVKNLRAAVNQAMVGMDAVLNPDCPLAIFREFEASCEPSRQRLGEAGSNGYH